MKTPRDKLITTTLLALVSTLVLNCAGQHLEPTFAGKTLSTWLQQFRSTLVSSDKMDQNSQAIEAVQSIGTNAIPTLLRMIRSKSSSKMELGDRNIKGMDGFFILGVAASNAVPELIEIMGENKSPSSQAAAAHALANIGPGATAAIPALARMATNSQSRIRSLAFIALVEIPASFDVAMPIATQALSDTNYTVSFSAMRLLANCGSNAAASVSALARVSTNADYHLRGEACVTLGKIHSLPEITVSALVVRLSDPVEHVREAAAWGLGNFGMLAKEAVPALVELRNDKDARVRSAAEDALNKINLENN